MHESVGKCALFPKNRAGENFPTVAVFRFLCFRSHRRQKMWVFYLFLAHRVLTSSISRSVPMRQVRGSAGDASRSRGFFTPQRLSASTLNAQPVVRLTARGCTVTIWA